ncbi:ABC transporter permease/substrate-binding protein [Melghirimyces algeriensis]|uniref:Osmoprotectant transport system permease protein n=1 Tax=Melghirimyces algeriensis TaxID=910412 RepID=A0A521EY48_9BACL|nr:ABC transporter permease/substrate-binding protein [Melghirimyces algeriensis]SMO88756.1 osmoprotectant transport system permease protein [Melghirimyces algeriensis]
MIRQWIQLVEKHADELVQTTWEHLQLSMLSLLLAVLIALPLGIYLSRKQKLAESIIGVTAVLQTIPSLALLGFMIPLLGIGKTPAVIALTAYALLPILRNTYTGIKEVDPVLTEAATGMGMSSWRRLVKVELPLAMPVIMAGIRTAMVLIVGTATLAALIGAGGLGDLILTGIQRADNGYILLGAIPAALLAIFFDLVLRLTEKRSRNASVRPIAVVGLLAVLVVLAPFVTVDSKEDIVIGGKLGAEPEILIHMYQILIEEKTDLTVQLKPRLGGTDFLFKALQKGDIDIYPEFTGTAITTLLKKEPSGTDEEAVYRQAREGLMDKYNLVMLKPMAYNNTYALAVKKKTAQKYNLKTISDLKPHVGQLKAGFTFEFKDRNDGYRGIQKVYGLMFPHLQTMDAGLRSKAIQTGDVDVIDAYSTDGYMIEYRLVALKDDQQLFPTYQGAPLMRKETLEKYPELEGALNQLAGRITEEEMQKMNHQVDFKDADPKQVASNYLKQEGLVE